MFNMSSAEARNHFPDLVSQAAYGKKRTVITRRGKKVAAIIPIEDLERLMTIEDAIDIREAEEILVRGKFEDWEEAKNEIMTHFGFEDDLQNQNRRESKKVHKKSTKI